MKKLATSAFRSLAGVLPSNKFLFASSHSSESHVSGWHAINGICKDLSLHSYEDLIATNNRHRNSTLFVALDVPTKDRELFYSHMGHSERMNKDIYQAPLAIHAITTIGKQLMKLDAGIQFSFYLYYWVLLFY